MLHTLHGISASSRQKNSQITPTDIADLAQWNTLAGLASGSVSTWSDISGNGRHLTQSNNSFKPNCVADQYVEFSSSQRLEHALPFMVASGEYTHITVLEMLTFNNGMTMASEGSASGLSGFHSINRITGANNSPTAQTVTDSNTSILNDSSLNNTINQLTYGKYVYMQFWDGTTVNCMINDTVGNLTRSLSISGLSPTRYVLGGRGYNGTVDRLFRGKIYENIIYSRNLDSDEKDSILAYLYTKHGITP